MRTKLFLTVFIALAFGAAIVWGTSAVSADTGCDNDYVKRTRKTVTIKPTGTDDTANLQCAFDVAVSLGAGAQVRLKSGTFHTGQIVVNGLNGKLKGAGLKNTIVTNLPNLYVTQEDFYFNPPSADNPWPSLFAFVEGNFTVSDLAIHISGDNGTTGWTIFGIDPLITELAHGIAILGPEANAQFEHVLVEGEPADNTLFGFNLINGIFYEGFIGENPAPVSGNFTVKNSTFRAVGSGTPISNLSDATVTVSHNDFEGVYFAMDGGDFINSAYVFSHNNIDAITGLSLYNGFATEDVGSTLLIEKNTFRGETGIDLAQTFGEGNTCEISKNDFQGVTGTKINLGDGVTGCIVTDTDNK
jgi:hypothetical protein